jgi:signal transduction histidine kinase
MIFSTLLLAVLVGLMLFLIERREVNDIIQESKNQGLLTAKYIASLNLRPLMFWEEDTIKKSVDEQVDEKLLYIIFYDRFNNPYVANDFIRSYEDIYCCSRLPEVVTEESSFFQAKRIQVNGRDERVLEIEVPIFAKGSPDRWGSIKIGLSLEDMHADIRKTRMILILVGFCGVLMGIVGATLLARRIVHPLRKLVDGTIRVSQGDFSHNIQLKSRDEIGDLAQSFNQMSSQLLQARVQMENTHKKLMQAEKLASIGRISATIAHEIRNPLTSIKLNIQRISDHQDLDDVEREHLAISQEGIGQIEKFIKELLNFTKVSELNRDWFSMEQILEESIKIFNDPLRQKKITLEKRYDKDIPEALVDGDRLRQVFSNIIRNAQEAIDSDGKIIISLSHLPDKPEGRIRIRISDNGGGIPESDWENIFEPFYTTKAAGFGLGLPNARKIVEQHGGTIRVVKKRGKGTCFEILLPIKGAK